MPFVLDASVTLAWAFLEERTPYTVRVQESLRSGAAITSAIWPLEVANALLVAERRGRLTSSGVAQFTTMVLSLRVNVEESVSARALHAVLSVAKSQGLSAYDASYLELAMRTGLPLATLDSRLRSAAVAVGVPLLAASVEDRA